MDVGRDIGHAFPQLENEINTSKLSGIDALICFLRDNEFRCTGKLISRLLAYDDDEIEGVLAALDRRKRDAIHQAILEEGLYNGAFFAKKMGVVERTIHGG